MPSLGSSDIDSAEEGDDPAAERQPETRALLALSAAASLLNYLKTA